MPSTQICLAVWLGLIWLGTVSIAPAADVRSYAVLKGHFLIQSTAGTPVSDPDYGHAILASVDLTDYDLVTNASVQFPEGGSIALDNLGDEWDFFDSFSSLGALNSNYGFGNYTLSFKTLHDGNYSCVLNFPSTALPPAPHLTNYSAVQAVNPLQPLTLYWDFPSPPNSSDYIQVYVDAGHGTVYSSPDFGEPGALNGTARSVTIPARTLPSGSTLSLNIEIDRVASTNGACYPYAEGATATFRSTEIEMFTINPPPQLRIFAPTNAVVGIEVLGGTGTSNILQARDSFTSGSWVDIATNAVQQGRSLFSVPAPGLGRVFRSKQ